MKPGTQLGPYRIERRVATGGMAEVFLAQTDDGAEVAIKRMKPSAAVAAGFLEMFLDEASIAKRFEHPNVLEVHAFEEGPPPYLVMEYIDGPDLRRLAWEARKKQGQLPVDIAAAVVSGAARGLHYAHRLAGDDGTPLCIVHRDMSPQNVMLTRAGQVKVVDFGIARAVGRNTRTAAGIIKGKYAYMAPEQIVGGGVSARTDVFALGILLYEAITDHNPFKRERDDHTLIAVVKDVPPPMKDRRPEVPDDLEQVVARALVKAIDARWESAGAFADAIDACIAARRAPVTPAHLADYLQGLAALPMPDEPPPEPEEDSEIAAIELDIELTEHGLEPPPLLENEPLLKGMVAEAPLLPPQPGLAKPSTAPTLLVPRTTSDPRMRYAELQSAVTAPQDPLEARDGWKTPAMILGGLIAVGLAVGAAIAMLAG